MVVAPFVTAVAAVATLLVTPLVRWIALRFKIVARPGGRNVHEGLVPRIGGLSLYLGVVAALLVALLHQIVHRFDDGARLVVE